jgi:preprotein translocase subunit SecF
MLSSATESTKSRFDFLKYRYFWLAISVLYFVVGAAAYVMKGGFTYHIDFIGGAEIRVSFDKPVDIGQVRDVISHGGWKDAIIQSVGLTDHSFLIRIGTPKAETESQISAAMAKELPDNKMRVESIQYVGAEAGKDTTYNAFLSVLISLFVLLLYIAARFEFRFGVGAVISLVHDILAVMVFILLTGEPISLHVLASILAVLGYSMNDTCVIFGRIRENLAEHSNLSEYDLFNLSINQTLKRTLLTSFATGLSVLAIIIWGGETLRGLSVVMLVGIIVGTYSSIYIASPATLAIKLKK